MGASVPGRATRRSFATAIAAVLACAAEAAAPTPSPGPAARAGSAVDRAWDQVSGSVSEALLVVRIRVALLERLKEDGMRVTIEVHGAKVELSGQVERRQNVDLAERVAASVQGVQSVRSRVTLAPNGEALEPPVAHALGKVERGVADALLEAKVKARLLGELGRVAFDIKVEATNGVVSLSGTVPDGARDKLAVKVAQGTSGVKELHDLLTVKQ